MADALPIPQVSDVAHIIQLALAPVFLLAGVGTFLNVCTGRLARVVDRSRDIMARVVATSGPEHDRLIAELRLLDRRMQVVSRAILLSVASAGMICLVVILLFASEIVATSLSRVVALLFIVAMATLASAYATFIYEIHLASRTIRISDEVLFHEADAEGTSL